MTKVLSLKIRKKEKKHQKMLCRKQNFMNWMFIITAILSHFSSSTIKNEI